MPLSSRLSLRVGPHRLVAAVVAGALVVSGLAAGIAATAATSQNGLTLSVEDGQTVSGVVNLTARDDQAADLASITVDGVPLDVTRTDPAVALKFQAHGWEANTVNTFTVNGTYEIRPMTRYYDWADGSWPVPTSVLHPGVNTIELKVGSTTTVLDPGDNANDDFNIRSVRLAFADGTALADSSISPANKTIGMGDGSATALRTFTWNVTVPAVTIAPTATALWNTDDAGPGDHVVTATSADGTRTASATVHVDGPGTPEESDDSGIAFSIADGSTVSGITTVTASDSRSDEPTTVWLDGARQQVTPRDAGASIAFEAHGYLAAPKNTIVINGDWTIVPATAYNDYATGRFPIPSGALHPGMNTIEFYTGSNEMMNDPATDGRNDDFNIRNLRIEFSDGTSASDPAMSPTAIANLGDNGNNVRRWQWDITVPADQLVSGSTFTWDTTASASGPHTLRAVSADGTRHEEITALVDNYEAVTLDAADGDQVRGPRTLTVTTDVEPQVTVDGQRLPVELRRRVVDPVFAFEADGFQPDAAMDSIWVNGELYRVLGVPEAAHGYRTVRVPIPWELLRPGANSIRIRAGGNLSPTGDDADSFSTRNSRLLFAGDRVLPDPAHTPTQTLSYGPSTKFRDFSFTIPDRFETVYQADWDSATVADGEHVVEVTRADGRSAASATVVVDNTGPVVAVGAPADGSAYAKTSFVVDTSADDVLHGVASFRLDIDGTTVNAGDTVSADDLTSGEHVLTAQAVDTLGNETVRTVRFTTTGNAPSPAAAPSPQDGATGVSTRSLQLGATVSDPAGDRVDATVKWGYRSDFQQGGVRALGGASTTATPERSAGDELDDADYEALAQADGRAATTTGDKAYPFQQFEVEVPADLETFDVTWVGSVPDAQRAALSVWNHATSSWQLLDEGTGGNLTLTGSATASDVARDGVATVMVQDVAATVIAEDGADAVWAWISDTQFYAQNDPSVYEKQVRWVLDNQDAEGIGYAVHTGDIVNTKDENEWRVADGLHQLWDDAGLPYGMLVGNHDVDTDGTYTTYQKYFGEHRFAGKPWYGGSHEDNVEHYDILSTPEADYLVVFVDWLLDQDDIDWANEVIRSHPDYNVIVAEHQYFDDKGGYINPAPQVWDQIVAPNPNVDVVLSGHVGIWLNQKPVGGDRKVIEVMADYQSAPNNGDGWMRTITFDPTAQTFSNRTFSVTHDRTWWKNDAMENFTVPMSIEAPERSVSTDYVGVSGRSSEVVGSVADLASGERATVRVEGLEPGTRYAWYVETADADGFTTPSPVWTFTTGDADGSTNHQTLAVDVPEAGADGELIWGIDGGNGLVDLGVAENRGDHFEASGAINPVRVTDTRRPSATWSLSARVSDFTGDAGTFSGKYLGWRPRLVEAGGGAVPGAPVASGFDSGNGLSEASGLGSAPTGHERGSARLGADLALKLPLEVGQGTYRATLTLTALG